MKRLILSLLALLLIAGCFPASVTHTSTGGDWIPIEDTWRNSAMIAVGLTVFFLVVVALTRRDPRAR